ncbi:hypothetical protein BD311DRAFT_313382 [Dichomitus squalens]|uniref:Uncharacterized protein n=1 Tax=Dichomitus squalens TaxID=114155 RepID=A0A4Q9MNJ6_9APHY|nr:hypothetical protein BD311DRAFT_313382 [Dichomitus squalens]
MKVYLTPEKAGAPIIGDVKYVLLPLMATILLSAQDRNGLKKHLRSPESRRPDLKYRQASIALGAFSLGLVSNSC